MSDSRSKNATSIAVPGPWEVIILNLMVVFIPVWQKNIRAKAQLLIRILNPALKDRVIVFVH